MLAVCGIDGQEEKMLKNVDLATEVAVLPFTDVRDGAVLQLGLVR